MAEFLISFTFGMITAFVSSAIITLLIAVRARDLGIQD